MTHKTSDKAKVLLSLLFDKAKNKLEEGKVNLEKNVLPELHDKALKAFDEVSLQGSKLISEIQSDGSKAFDELKGELKNTYSQIQKNIDQYLEGEIAKHKSKGSSGSAKTATQAESPKSETSTPKADRTPAQEKPEKKAPAKKAASKKAVSKPVAKTVTKNKA